MKSKQSDRSGRHWSWAAGAGLALAASALLADTQKAAPSGLMTFDNVTVVNAPEAVQTMTATHTAQGMRAYVDAGTRQLRAQTREEGMEAAADTKAKAPARAPSRARSLSVETAAAEPELIYGVGDTVGVVLTDEYLVYQVVRKSDEGFQKVEVTGKSAAEAALEPKSSAKSSVKSNVREVGHAH